MAAKTSKIFVNFARFCTARVLAFNCRRACSSYGQSSQSTVDSEEVFKFSELCNEFWNINGPFQALHTMNRIRVPLIRDALLQNIEGSRFVSKPLNEKNILDIGCGGGILCEPIARLGANVVGIDASEEAISVAQHHAKHDPEICGRLEYRCMTAEDLVEQTGGGFDAVIASEVIEHVSDQEFFVETCAKLTKPGGTLMFTTINRTIQSYLLAILAAEYVLNVVERGTHDWNKFVPDDELASLVIHNGFRIHTIQGLCYNPFTRVWSKFDDTSVNYALVAQKLDENS
ncbi:ubiquinone biosynthesis O-methyltransferase, mitochondrial-like [Dendronephthya gigantea]|uniref:ubiquinone biosynthesis O-methyltransferase, mitochondrial-like n=1 Tax=Dendronephthya gigantea TaxID=151771 RepID=UPI00106C4DFC|nr:ubiquinone biosynthesis O-methyltransferase, mitochondrial-like [Dendronephthya gigantea]